MSDRVFCPGPPVAGRWIVEGEEAHHLANVRRLGPGAEVHVFDGKGPARRARILAVGRGRVELEAVDEGNATGIVPDVHLTLGTAVPKGDRFDWIVEKATELGVTTLAPLITARSVVDPRPSKLERLRRTVIEACKQSGRDRLMEVEAPCPWAEWLSRHAAVRPVYVADPSGDPVASLLNALPPGAAALAIGPEGGFTPEEVAAARAAGGRTIGLGPTILRVETAAVVGSALLLTWMRGSSQP